SGPAPELARTGAVAAVAEIAAPARVTGPAAVARGEPSAWMVIPVAAGALALLLLGIHPPAELTELFGRAIRLLTGAGS
ncbi:MAG: hypothetical protein WAK71_18750, partial [Streptosporangiaceae bacterium]